MGHLIGRNFQNQNCFSKTKATVVLKIAIFHGLFYTYNIGMDIYIIITISTHEYYVHIASIINKTNNKLTQNMKKSTSKQ